MSDRPGSNDPARPTPSRAALRINTHFPESPWPDLPATAYISVIWNGAAQVPEARVTGQAHPWAALLTSPLAPASRAHCSLNLNPGLVTVGRCPGRAGPTTPELPTYITQADNIHTTNWPWSNGPAAALLGYAHLLLSPSFLGFFLAR